MANGHGGRRPNAGRKAGFTTQKTRAIADAAAAAGITPLQVMIEAMRRHYDAKDLDAAAAIAKDAAPYMHPRLSTVELDATVRRDPIDLSDAELAALAAAGRTDAVGPQDSPPKSDRLH
jgi:hypothetical protein